MVIVGLNTAWGLDTLAAEHYILGSLQLLVSIFVYWLYDKDESTQESKKWAVEKSRLLMLPSMQSSTAGILPTMKKSWEKSF